MQYVYGELRGIKGNGDFLRIEKISVRCYTDIVPYNNYFDIGICVSIMRRGRENNHD